MDKTRSKEKLNKQLNKIKMKILTKQSNHRYWLMAISFWLLAFGNQSYAQDKDSVIARAKNTFRGNLIIDNQTVMVPVKKTFEFTIQHRFGTIVNEYSDFFGLFAPANI